MSRTLVFGGNWKMNPTDVREAHALAAGVRRRLGSWHKAEVLIFVPGPYLSQVAAAVADSQVKLGAQDLFPADKGAYTGGMSPPMLQSVGVTDVLVGHSERRQVFGEDDAVVGAKLRAALQAGLRPTLCFGETREERDAGATLAVLTRQLDVALHGVTTLDGLILAYEPVWAIGTGLTASPEQAQDTHAAVRAHLRGRFGEQADAVRIQYGGSVKPHNAAELMSQPDIDGALVGGASLDADSFAAIVKAPKG